MKIHVSVLFVSFFFGLFVLLLIFNLRGSFFSNFLLFCFCFKFFESPQYIFRRQATKFNYFSPQTYLRAHSTNLARTFYVLICWCLIIIWWGHTEAYCTYGMCAKAFQLNFFVHKTVWLIGQNHCIDNISTIFVGAHMTGTHVITKHSTLFPITLWEVSLFWLN